MIVDAFLLIPFDKRLRLVVIHHEAFFDGLLVVISTSTLLSAQDESLHQFVLWHIQLYHGCHLVATLFQHLLQCLCLWDGTGESIEDYALVRPSERVIHRGEDAHHQIVRNQLSIVDIPLCRLTQFCTFLDLCTKHVTSRDMFQTIFLDEFVALGALA